VSCDNSGNASAPAHVCTGVNTDIASRLQALDELYTTRVNEAVAEDRPDLIRVLVAEYPDAVAAVLAEAA
jgi:hypothetical protein